MKKNDIKISGHKEGWSVIDEGFHKGKKVFLLESEVYGDEAPCIIVDENLKIIREDVYNGLDELDE